MSLTGSTKTQRRVVTYGKVTKRPISTIDDLGSEDEIQTSPTKSLIRSKSATRAIPADIATQPRQTTPRVAFAQSTKKVTKPRRRSPIKSPKRNTADIVIYDGLYDVPSSEGEGQPADLCEGPPYKRRKLQSGFRRKPKPRGGEGVNMADKPIGDDIYGFPPTPPLESKMGSKNAICASPFEPRGATFAVINFDTNMSTTAKPNTATVRSRQKDPKAATVDRAETPIRTTLTESSSQKSSRAAPDNHQALRYAMAIDLPKTPPRSRHLEVRTIDASPSAPSPGIIDLNSLSIATPSPAPSTPRASSDVSSDGRIARMRGIRSKMLDRSGSSISDSTLQTMVENDNRNVPEGTDVGKAKTEDEASCTDTLASQTVLRSTVATSQHSQIGVHKITYSKQRSHLAEGNLIEDWTVPLETDTIPAVPLRRRAQHHIQQTAAPRVDDLEDEEENSQTKGLRSVHELRAAGGTMRKGGEIDALFVDITAGDTKSIKRTAIFNLALRILNPEFREELRQGGYLLDLFTLCGTGTDIIFDILLVMAMVPLMSLLQPLHLNASAGSAMVLNFLNGCLRDDRPIARTIKRREHNMSKAQQKNVEDLLSKIVETLGSENLDPSISTPRLLALHCLEEGVRRLRQSGSVDRLLPSDGVRVCFRLLANRTSGSDQSAIHERRLGLSLLEALSGTIAASGNPVEAMGLVRDDLTLLAESIPTLLNRQANDSHDQAHLALRLCLNLTNGSAEDCIPFTTEAIVTACTDLVVSGFNELSTKIEERLQDPIIDSLVLALGFMTNLTEEVDRTREIFRSSSARHCAPIDGLTRAFRARVEHASEVLSEAESKANVPFGYLAVLLCSLCLDRETRIAFGGPSKHDSVKQLLTAVDEFLLYYRSISIDIRERGDDDSPQDVTTAFVDRLQQVVDRFREACVEDW